MSLDDEDGNQKLQRQVFTATLLPQRVDKMMGLGNLMLIIMMSHGEWRYHTMMMMDHNVHYGNWIIYAVSGSRRILDQRRKFLLAYDLNRNWF